MSRFYLNGETVGWMSLTVLEFETGVKVGVLGVAG